MTQYEDYDPYEMNELRFHDGCLISRYRNLSWTLLDLTQQVVNGLIIAVREQDAAREQRLAALLTKAMWVHDLVERRLSRLIRAEDKRRWHEKREARRAATGHAMDACAPGGREVFPVTEMPSKADRARVDGLQEAAVANASTNRTRTDEQDVRTPERHAPDLCTDELEPRRTTGNTASHAAVGSTQDDSALEGMLESVVATLARTEPGAAAPDALAPP